jgi:hypothetical protein
VFASSLLLSKLGGWRAALTSLDTIAGSSTGTLANLRETGNLRTDADYDRLVVDHGRETTEEWIEKLGRDREAIKVLIGRLRSALKRTGATR